MQDGLEIELGQAGGRERDGGYGEAGEVRADLVGGVGGVEGGEEGVG